MKIAIIGGGTAGYIAAAQVTKKFPEFELYHIYDSNIPVIGVGEGTILGFPEWLSEITNLSYDELQKRCCLTRKFGACFENWGVEHKKFMHHFYPINEASAYHISADKLVELLKEYVQATRINKKVTNLESDGATANVCFEDNTNLKVDIAIDARGFPKTLDRDRIELSWIPTNAALIRQSSSLNQNISVELGEQVLEYKSATRGLLLDLMVGFLLFR